MSTVENILGEVLEEDEGRKKKGEEEESKVSTTRREGKAGSPQNLLSSYTSALLLPNVVNI